MKVNPTTGLFEELTEANCNDLLQLAKGIVLNGNIPPFGNSYVAKWRRALNLNETQFVMSVTTAFPARALLSVVDNLQASSKPLSERDKRQVRSLIVIALRCRHDSQNARDPYLKGYYRGQYSALITAAKLKAGAKDCRLLEPPQDQYV